MSAKVQIISLDAPVGDSALDQLADVLVDCVEGGASVSFMAGCATPPSCGSGSTGERVTAVGWVEPTGRANARPMMNSAIPITFVDVADGFRERSTHPTN